MYVNVKCRKAKCTCTYSDNGGDRWASRGGYEGTFKGVFRAILLCWIECVFVGVAGMSPKCWPRKGNELK